MTTVPRHIDFYFDFISHNAYLAWHVLPELAQKHTCTLRPIPVLFAGFLKAYGQLGPAEVEPKLKWMNQNVLRKATELGIRLAPPKQHPFRPLLLLRLASLKMTNEERCVLTGILFRGVWVDKLDPNDPGAVRDYLEVNNFPAGDLIERVDDEAAKTEVKTNTDECLARGGFGVPTMMMGDELFWGFDDLPFLEKLLTGNDPLNEADVDAYVDGWNLARAQGAHRTRG